MDSTTAPLGSALRRDWEALYLPGAARAR